MPEMFRKTLLVPGTHHAPQGVQVVSPERIRRWVDKFRQLKSAGVRFPVPWGHRLSAIPEYGTVDDAEYQNAVERRAFEEARYNAGFIEGMEIGPNGELVITAPVPPGYKVCPQSNDLINEHDGTRIGEMSAGIGHWRDGKGQSHKDIIIHAALVPLPIWAGQDGFSLATTTQAATLSGSQNAIFTCTLSSKTGGNPMEPEEDETPEVDAEDDVYEPEPEAPPEDAAPIVPPAPPPVDYCEQALALLSQMGLALPQDTDSENFCERLVIALTVAQSMGAKFDRDDDTEDETANPPATMTSGDGGQPPSPEAPPVMMSTRDIVNPAFRALAARQERQTQAEVSAIWEELKGLGCPVYIADRESAKATQIHLSINRHTGKASRPAQLQAARLVKEILQAQHGIVPKAKTTATLSTTVAVPSPMTTKKRPEDETSFATQLLRRVTGDNGARIASAN